MDKLRRGFKPESKRLAFLDQVLASDASAALSEDDIKEELRTLIWAGSTTTTDYLSFFFIAMSLLPDIQSKIHEVRNSQTFWTLGEEGAEGGANAPHLPGA